MFYRRDDIFFSVDHSVYISRLLKTLRTFRQCTESMHSNRKQKQSTFPKTIIFIRFVTFGWFLDHGWLQTVTFGSFTCSCSSGYSKCYHHQRVTEESLMRRAQRVAFTFLVKSVEIDSQGLCMTITVSPLLWFCNGFPYKLSYPNHFKNIILTRAMPAGHGSAEGQGKHSWTRSRDPKEAFRPSPDSDSGLLQCVSVRLISTGSDPDGGLGRLLWGRN